MHLIYLVPGRLSKKHVVLQKDTLKPLHDYQLVILAGPVPSLLSLQPCDSQAKKSNPEPDYRWIAERRLPCVFWLFIWDRYGSILFNEQNNLVAEKSQIQRNK